MLRDLLGRDPTGPGEDCRVMVAIFDTWPVEEPSAVTGIAPARGDPREKLKIRRRAIAKRYAWRLDEAIADGVADITAGHVHDDYLDPQGRTNLECRTVDCHGTVPDHFDRADHGLFIADIIKDIAPHAELHVYRVMEDGSASDYITIAQAIRDAVDDAAGRPLIMNFSLGFGAPMVITREVLDWPGAFFDNPALVTRTLETKMQRLGQSHIAGAEIALLAGEELLDATTSTLLWALAPFEELYAVKQLPNVLVVAAAGNDSCRPNRLFGPRAPALIEGILGVSSYVPQNGVWVPASFSNNDDFYPPDDGIGAFGGQIDPQTNQMTQGLVALFVAPRVPPYKHPSTAPPAAPNETGWAKWAGTSFATPILSALAACLWCEVLQLLEDQRPPNIPLWLIKMICTRQDGTPRPAIELLQV